nr:MAG TPA: hypothetical protein [Caudoviricetes sp.]
MALSFELNEPASFPTKFPKLNVVILQKEVVRWLDHVN